MRHVVYIAGPYRANGSTGPGVNIERARGAALRVWRAGGLAICPHLNSADFDVLAPDVPDDAYLELGLHLVACSDLVWRIPGDSAGADAEVAHARTAGVPVAFEWADVERFLEAE